MNLADKIILLMNEKSKTPEFLWVNHFKNYSLSYIKRVLKDLEKRELIIESYHCNPTQSIKGKGYAYSTGYYLNRNNNRTI